MTTGAPTVDWQQDVFDVLKQGDVRQIAYVPDAGHAASIRAAGRPRDQGRGADHRGGGVALGSGAWLGGQRAVLLMQSSGVGNCINMFSLLQNCRFPFLTLVTMRGEYAEFNPWQNPMGLATQRCLELMGITVVRANKPEEVRETVAAAFDSVFLAGERTAVLLGQELIGRKKWAGN